jgi:hypothetical protein
MKYTIVSLILLISTFSISAQPKTHNKVQVQKYSVGGLTIKIPCPDSTFIKADSLSLEAMKELAVPPESRLITAFVLKEESNFTSTNDVNNRWTKYGMVEIVRKCENINIKESDFKEVIASMNQYKQLPATEIMEAENKFNRKMDSLDIENMQIKIGELKDLGCFFSKKDIYGRGLISVINYGNNAYKLCGVTIVIRVKNRLIILYLNAEYKNIDTINWIRKVGQSWSENILKVNTIQK